MEWCDEGDGLRGGNRSSKRSGVERRCERSDDDDIYNIYNIYNKVYMF